LDRIAGGVAVSQLVTDFGRTANLTASSEYRARAAKHTAAASREQILLAVDSGYLSALEAEAVLKVTRQTLQTRQLLLDQVSLLASNKLRSELDVSFARVATGEARLLVQKAQNDADAAMASLSATLGFRETRNYQLVETELAFAAGTNDVSQLVETALAGRPELLSLRADQNALQRLARSERDARLPEVRAVGLAGDAPWRDHHLPENYAVGGVQLSVPLFAGGYYLARQREAELQADADAELLRSAENNVVRDVRIAWLNVGNAREQIQNTRQLMQCAAEAYELAEARYKVGSSSIVELSQAQLNQTSAQIADANARYNLLIQQANLDYQAGKLH
jgi:outer membrane protein